MFVKDGKIPCKCKFSYKVSQNYGKVNLLPEEFNLILKLLAVNIMQLGFMAFHCIINAVHIYVVLT